MATPVDVDRSKLHQAFPARGRSDYEYFEDEEGSLYAEKPGSPLMLLAVRGVWQPKDELPVANGAAMVHHRLPVATESPAPAPEGVLSVNDSKRRYSFTYRTTVKGVVGALTIEATTGFEMAGALAEAVRRFKPLDEPPRAFTVFPDDTAWCEKHQAIMTKREKQGDVWWSHDTGNECWCKGRPGKDSPGWEHS